MGAPSESKMGWSLAFHDRASSFRIDGRVAIRRGKKYRNTIAGRDGLATDNACLSRNTAYRLNRRLVAQDVVGRARNPCGVGA